MQIIKNSQEFCVLYRVQSVEVLDQIEGNSAPYSPLSQVLQPYSHSDSSNLAH
jgi:hypothetical protein